MLRFRCEMYLSYNDVKHICKTLYSKFGWLGQQERPIPKGLIRKQFRPAIFIQRIINNKFLIFVIGKIQYMSLESFCISCSFVAT